MTYRHTYTWSHSIYTYEHKFPYVCECVEYNNKYSLLVTQARVQQKKQKWKIGKQIAQKSKR